MLAAPDAEGGMWADVAAGYLTIRVASILRVFPAATATATACHG